MYEFNMIMKTGKHISYENKQDILLVVVCIPVS